MTPRAPPDKRRQPDEQQHDKIINDVFERLIHRNAGFGHVPVSYTHLVGDDDDRDEKEDGEVDGVHCVGGLEGLKEK